MNSEYVLRSGPYDMNGDAPSESKELQEVCAKKYQEITQGVGELLVSCSDDFTLYLWNPLNTAKPIIRMTGHQQPVNFVQYSPDGKLIASASFDKSVRLWNGVNGKFVAVFRAHVQVCAEQLLCFNKRFYLCVRIRLLFSSFRSHHFPPRAYLPLIQSVYQVAWSADSRMVVSSSKDSTIKLWSVSKKKMIEDLPGHADEVYAVDWSPDGERVASGGKDKLLKIWRA